MKKLVVAAVLVGSLLGISGERASAHEYEVWDCANNIVKVYGHVPPPGRYPFHVWVRSYPIPSYYC